MSQSSTVSSQPPPRRRLPRQLLVALLIFVGLPAAYYFFAAWSLDRDITQALDETDALDPRWRFEDMQKDRASVADDENSALHVITVVQTIGRNSRSFGYHKVYGVVFDQLAAPTQLNPQQVELIREGFEKAPGAATEARKFKDMPHGRFALSWAADGLTFLLPDQQDVRFVCDLLKHDAMLRAQQGDPDGALASCMALLNAARSLDDEPFLTSMLIRAFGHSMLVAAVERTLAQGYPADAPMQELQARIRRERGDLHAHWITVVRGDRALYHRFMDALRHRKIRISEHMQKSWRMRTTLQDRFADYMPALYTKNYPKHLRQRNELVAAARLPLAEQLDRFTALARQINRSDDRLAMISDFIPLLPPDLTKTCSAHLRAQALLTAAEAGLACERYRLARKRWPQQLADLVEAGLLDSIPTDPFDGRPLRLARLKDGIVVFSVGHEQQDGGGHLDRDRPQQAGVDVGFRLWGPEQRRQAARPAVAVE